MTRLLRWSAIALLVAAAPLAGEASHTKKRAVARTYSTPAPFIEPACYLLPTASDAVEALVGEGFGHGMASDAGGACIRVAPADHTVGVVLVDDAGWRVSGTAYFRDALGQYIEGAQYGICAARTFSVPEGAATMVVTAEASNVWCLLRESGADSGPATTGSILATFLRG